jgi:hypothetical protein
MAELIHRADIKLATATLAAVEAAVSAAADRHSRPHLGASTIGKSCARALWYAFRWVAEPAHDARMLRLFQRGQDEEERLVRLLRNAGLQVVTIDAATGQQYRFSDIGGHFGGSMDGACLGVPDAPHTWHVFEAKTHNTKSFKALQVKGVAEAKPQHLDQMQIYMAWSGMTRALYVAVCKDDDQLHIERVDADPARFKVLRAKALSVITASEPPAGVSTDESYFECRFCEYRGVCHGTQTPLPNCRSCVHATPELDGNARWSCDAHQQDLGIEQQRAGCADHRYIPILLRNFGRAVDADPEAVWVEYQSLHGGQKFRNGRPPEAYTSAEIHAARDKAALGTMAADEFVQNMRTQFGAKVVA